MAYRIETLKAGNTFLTPKGPATITEVLGTPMEEDFRPSAEGKPAYHNIRVTVRNQSFKLAIPVGTLVTLR